MVDIKGIKLNSYCIFENIAFAHPGTQQILDAQKELAKELERCGCEKEIANFIPEPYWMIKAQIEGDILADSVEGKIFDKEKAEKIYNDCTELYWQFLSNENGMYGRIGKLNPMYGHSCFEFMTEEQILNWKHKQSLSHKGKRAWNKGKTNVYSKETLKKISETRIKNKCAKGKNNPMYDVSLITLLSADEIKQWKNKLSEKSKGRKHMYHPETLKNINPKIEDIQKYLELGYVLGQYNKNKKNKQSLFSYLGIDLK